MSVMTKRLIDEAFPGPNSAGLRALLRKAAKPTAGDGTADNPSTPASRVRAMARTVALDAKGRAALAALADALVALP